MGKTSQMFLINFVLSDLKRLFNTSWICYLLAVAIPLILLISWHNSNTLYPNDDAANYLGTAQNIYLQYKSSGFVQGTLAAYFDRGWRPILFPVLAVPFLAIGGGDILFAVSATMVFIYIIFLTYAYLIAREFLSPWRSAVCTIFIGTIPWVITFAYVFMSEMALMAFSIASLFHLIKSDFFSSLKHSIFLGLWMALALTVRPIEFFLAFGILLLVFVYTSYKKQNVNSRDLIATVSILFITCLLLLVRIFFPISLNVLAVLWSTMLLLSAIPLLFWRRLGFHLPYLLTFYICNFLASAWWLKGIRDLYSWVYETSFGTMPRLYSGQGHMNFFDAIINFFSALGGYPLLGILGLVILGILAMRQKKNMFCNYVPVFVAILSMIIVPLVLISMSPSADYRRAFVGFAVLILATSILAVHPKLILPRLRLLLLIILTLTLVLVVFANTFEVFPEGSFNTEPYFKNTPRPFTGGDPSARFFQEINALPLGKAYISVFSLAVYTPWDRPFDPHALNVLARKYQSNLSFGYPWNFVSLKDGYESLNKYGYSYVVVDVTTEASVSSKAKEEPYSRLTSDIIEKWKQSTLEKVGLSYVTEFYVSNKTILLLMMQQSGEPKLSFKDNIGLAANGGIAGATSNQLGFPALNLNDGSDASWGSTETNNDTIFYITGERAISARIFKIVLFSPPNGGHVRDLSVVATNDTIDGNEKWHIIKSRIGSNGDFTEKITIPNELDKTVIKIELDTTDANWQAYKTFGLACFSKSKSYNRNYVYNGNGIYIIEFQISEKRI